MENNFEAFDGKIVHPSLDHKDGIVTLGFNYRNKEMKDARVWIIAAGSEIQMLTNDSFDVKGQVYNFDNKRGSRLASLEDRWGIADAKAFIGEQSHLIPSETSQPSHALVERVAAQARKHIEFENELDSFIIAAWIIGSYFHRIFHAFPFLHIKAPKGSGKSQCLNFLGQMCFNATKARPSLAALGDTVDVLRGTYLIDQADSLARKGSEELLDILADSYKRGGGKRRIVNIEKGHREILEFETYAPKAFASIKELPEDLRDRCFLLTLTRSKRTDLLDPDDPSSDWRTSRAELYKAFLNDYRLVDGTYVLRRIEYKQSKSIVGRKLELWLPLEVILQSFGAGGKIEAVKARFFAQYGFAEYEPDELEEAIVLAILANLKGISEIELSPKEISEKIDSELFRSNSDSKQRAAAVGWAIKKFNLSSGKTRGSAGNNHLFQKERVESIHASYFKTAEEHTSLTPSAADGVTAAELPMQEINASDF